MFGIDDAIGLGIGAVGLGMQIFGGSKQAEVSSKIAGVSKDEALHEQNINDLKTQQMETEGRRSQLQTIRNTQRARAMGINSSVNQGASQGTGLLGGIFDTQSQGLFNLQGINQGLEIGRNVNKENSAISQDKMKMADLQSDMASAQGMSSLGGSLMKMGGLVGGGLGSTILGAFGGGKKSSNPYYGPLDYNG